MDCLNDPLHSLVGLCALSVNHSNSYLAYPGSATIGEITLYDANGLVSLHLTSSECREILALVKSLGNVIRTQHASSSSSFRPPWRWSKLTTVPSRPSRSTHLVQSWPVLPRRWGGDVLCFSLLFFNSFTWMQKRSPLQGTVIRVFSVPEGQRLFEFRRGMKRWALVLSSTSTREVEQCEQTLERSSHGGGMRHEF